MNARSSIDWSVPATTLPETSVIIGRFNVPTMAHVHTFERAATRSSGRLAIGIINPGLWPLDYTPNLSAKQYIADADKQHEKTCFSITEREEMLRRTLSDVGLPFARIVTIGRPELSPTEFNNTLPPETHTLCVPAPYGAHNTGFDQHRDQQLPLILGRPVAPVTTRITHHNADIKERAVMEGGEVWKRHMTPKAYRHFRDIDGPERLRLDEYSHSH